MRGHRGNGESFMADVWFSTYKEGTKPKLAQSSRTLPTKRLPLRRSALHGQPRANRLTNRETEVLRFLVQGLANKEIAARMDISESSVKNTIQQLFAKTEVRTRAQLVRVALEGYRDLL